MDQTSDSNAVDLLSVVEELVEMIDGARKVPLTGRVMVDQQELMDLLDQLRDALPDELAQARWVLREKDRLLTQARSEAERIVREAASQAEELARESSIADAARKHAEAIVAQAKEVSREIRLSANEYTDGLLAKAHESLREGLRVIDAARSELRGQVAAAKTSQRRPADRSKSASEADAEERSGERSAPGQP